MDQHVHAEVGIDRPLVSRRWAFARWPLAARVGAMSTAVIIVVLLAVRMIAGSGDALLRVPVDQLTIVTVEQGVFHDLIPLRARVEPRQTVYVDAIDGGSVERLLVEAGDRVQEGQPLLEMRNANLAFSVIQEDSQINQAISQLQQNEIALEQNALSNQRAMAEVEFQLMRLERSAARRETLAAAGALAREQRDEVADELAYYRRLLPIQTAIGKHQSELRDRLVPNIHRQLETLRRNLDVVQNKLAGLIIRSPVTGVVTAIDLTVGEHRNAGQRLAVVTTESGMKLAADIDEYYLTRVQAGQNATVELGNTLVNTTVRRISPQVRDGLFTIDLEFDGGNPADLVAGKTVLGRLHLGSDTPALIAPTGAFLERSGGKWLFVLEADGRSAQPRQIEIGRRNSTQLEILSGLAAGERVVISDYTNLDRVDRLILTN